MVRRALPAVVAASDCERCRHGWITQPANTASSLAYVVSGVALLRDRVRARPEERPLATALAWSVVATGVGSVAYHGPGGRFSRWLHDAGILTMIGYSVLDRWSAATGRSGVDRSVLIAVPAVAAAGANPATSAVAQGLMGTVVVGAEAVAARRSGQVPSPTGLVAWSAAAAAYRLGQTGSPTCRPDSLLQPHAAWHILSALAVWLQRRHPA